jgi:glycosyltransferase involved in cell wall biosynthesis
MAPLHGVRIALVVGTLHLRGTQRQALRLAEHLVRAEGAAPEVWGTAGDAGSATASCASLGIPCHVVDVPWSKRRAERIVRLVGLAMAMRRRRPHALISYGSYPNLQAAYVWRLAGARTCVWSQRDAGYFIPYPTQKAAARRVPWFIANSSPGAAYLKVLEVPPHRVALIRNGVALDPPRACRAEWRRRLGLAGSDPAACMVASLIPPKDHVTLIRAWQQVVQRADGDRRRPPILLLAGETRETFPAAEALLREAGLAHVLFLGEVADVAGLLGAADLCVFSSLSEGSPNGVLEAMAAGLAVAATDLPGIREIVGEAGAPFLAPPRDAEALADRVGRLLASPETRRSLGQRNRRHVAGEYTCERMGSRTAALLCRALSPSG